MKHLVLIAGMYYPQPSPTGRCASRYVSLVKDKYRVDVIFIQSGSEKMYGKQVHGETLYGLCNWRLLTENWFAKRRMKTSHSILKSVYHAGVVAMKAAGRIQSVVFFPDNLRWYYKKSYAQLLKIHAENKIDVVLTVNSPFSAHLAGKAFKNAFPEVRWVTYTVDPYYLSSRIGKKFFGKNAEKSLHAEQEVLSHADINLLSEEIFENGKGLYASFKAKTFPLPYLMPSNDMQTDSLLFNHNKINLVYAGRFYKDIRNPEYLLKAFLGTKNKDLILHLYAASDCEELIDKCVRMSSGRIVRHELVAQDEIMRVINSADVLVSVGNSAPEFKPSKTFEYVSSGKPIIGIYKNKLQDTTLNLYPLAVQIDEDSSSVEEGSMLMENFSLRSKGKNADAEEIEHIYSKHFPTYIKKILNSAMEQ